MSEREDRQKELKEFRDEIVGNLDVGSEAMRLVQLQLARIVSHLESEQGTLIRALTMIQKHEQILHGDDTDEKPGLLFHVRSLVEGEKRKKKVNYTILGCVVSILAVEAGKLLFK